MTAATKPHSPLYIKGMHGLGDGIHQRALVRQYMALGYDVWLEGSYVSIYHDLVSAGLKVVRKPISLRTQTKNAEREAHLFHPEEPPPGFEERKVWWRAQAVRESQSVLAAMFNQTDEGRGELSYASADFRLPIPAAWTRAAADLICSWNPDPTKPIMIYRPLIERVDWNGSKARNPDYQAYWDLFSQIRDDFFVVSLADLAPAKEWLVGHQIEPDVTLHGGVPFETLAALFSLVSLVYAHPGFAIVLAQAVQTPVINIVGGYELSTSFSCGAKWSPYLGIDPIKPCGCFVNSHSCDKRIDIPSARTRVKSFASSTTATYGQSRVA